MDTPGSRPRTHNGQMIDVDDSQFEDMVKRALDSLPPKLGAEMANVAVTVQLNSKVDDRGYSGCIRASH
ncbi:putative Zn-dependent protease with MMP-like domain [Rhodococcus sp. 27YEA6]